MEFLSYLDVDAMKIILWGIVGFLISILLFLFFGYLWNYYILKELRDLNKSIQSLDNSILSLKSMKYDNNSHQKSM